MGSEKRVKGPNKTQQATL